MAFLLSQNRRFNQPKSQAGPYGLCGFKPAKTKDGNPVEGTKPNQRKHITVHPVHTVNNGNNAQFGTRNEPQHFLLTGLPKVEEDKNVFKAEHLDGPGISNSS